MVNDTETIVASVLITAGSVRVFSLMTSDYIQLNFTLESAVYFQIGDFVDDELFGRFVLSSDQMPNYNVTYGGYDYTLKFDKEYRLWSNKIFMLTTLDAHDTRIRKESDWCLTDKLSVHLDEVIHNLSILGYSGYSYVIESTAERASEVRFLEYKNKDIIASLKSMADEWGTEYWVTTDKVIHFGKCEASGSIMDFELGVSVESMTIQKNTNKFFNKIFAYGSTKNIPFNYRKELIFECDDITTQDGYTLYGDTARPITEAMAINEDSSSIRSETANPAYSLDTSQSEYVVAESQQISITIPQRLTGDISIEIELDMVSRWEVSIETDFIDSTTGRVVYSIPKKIESGYSQRLQFAYPIGLYVEEGTYVARTIIDINLSSQYGAIIDDFSMMGEISYRVGGSSKWANLYLESDTERANPYKVYFNPLHQVHTEQYYGYFRFDAAAPSGFAVGSRFYLEPLNPSEIPASYYTRDYYDPSSLSKVGEMRLALPLSTGGYLITDEDLTRDQIVESVVVFEDVYPHAIQKVASVSAEQKESSEEQQDGSSVTWSWLQYTLTATLADGNPFLFSTNYISDGATLQVKFITKEDLEAAGYTATSGAEYRLAGMTFDVKFDNITQRYVIVRNENYGAKLPNDSLKPMVGDPFVLINWNVKAMESLGLLDIAETELETKAQEYLDAIEQGQFTFNCNLMSNVLFDLADRAAYYNIGIPFHTAEGAQLYVRMPSGGYILPIEGQQVRVIHGALSEPKVSRVIGYQFKLDKPYDTPQYTIGETQAYSRLAQIEKDITKLQ